MSNLEPLWRFIGYLHLLEDPSRAHDRFGSFGDNSPHPAADPGGGPLASAAPLVFEDPGSVPMPIPAVIETLARFHIAPLTGKLIPLKPFSSPPSLATVPPPLPPPHEEASWPSQDFVVSHEYGIHFGQEVGQLLATINQANMMSIAETYLGSDGQIQLPTLADAAPVLDTLWQKAEALVPEDLRVPVVSGDPLVAMIRDHQADVAGPGHDQSSDGPLWNATYRDGTVVQSSVADAIPQAVSPPAAPDHGFAQVVHIGGNTAVNAAVLVDANTPGATRIVLGDVHQTDVIVQTNVLVDHLAVHQSGGAANLWIGHDVTTNVASFIQHDWSPGPAGSTPNGLFVQVDVLHGDVWNVKSLTQTNWLDSQGVAVETETQAFSTVTLGGNIQVNLADFQHWTAQYDMVVVLGNYHAANIIEQTNVLYHASDVSVSGDADASQTVVSGGNSLTNVATIEHYGTESLHPLSSEQANLASQLVAGTDPGESAWLPYAGSGNGALRVLAISGDYYDVNVVSQTNVMASTEVAVLQADGSGVPQYVSAGLNTTANEAHIVTSGSGQAFIGGDHYSDSLMIQANLVEPSSTVVKADPTALVNEAVAFVTDVAGAQDTVPASVVIHGNYDPSLHSQDLGAVMV